MRSPYRSLAAVALAAAVVAPDARAGGIPSPFGEPETSRPPAKRKPVETRHHDDFYAPGEIAPAAGSTTGTIERETLPSIEAAPAPATPPAPAVAAPHGSPAPPSTHRNEPAAPRDGAPLPPLDENARTVMRHDLAPVMAADGTGLPHELWRGLSVDGLEKLFAAIEIPPRSPVLHALLRRLLTSDAPPPAGTTTDPRFTAVRVEALDRSGLFEEAAAVLGKEPAAATDPVLAVASARAAIARGDRDAGCRNVQALAGSAGTLPPLLKGQQFLIAAYCAAAAGNMDSAQLQVAIAREQGIEASAGLDAIDAIAAGGRPAIGERQKVGPIDWRILELGGTIDAGALIERAGPGVLALISRDTATDPALRLAATEGAARLNAITPEALAQAYRTFPGGEAGGDGPAATATRHAALFQSAKDERTLLKKARLIRSFLDEARRSGLYWPALQMIASAASAINRVPEIGWFTETAIETALASGDFAAARSWAEFGESLDSAGRAGFAHWLALADITDPALAEGRSRHLTSLTEMASRGRFTPDQLHRLATVLDALQIQVPIPLWDLASRTPQPNEGFLPETGVLSALSEAAKRQEFGHTVLFAMQALGPNGAEGAHIIALGDSIRALRSASLEADARKLALEALFMGWPRAAGL